MKRTPVRPPRVVHVPCLRAFVRCVRTYERVTRRRASARGAPLVTRCTRSRRRTRLISRDSPFLCFFFFSCFTLRARTHARTQVECERARSRRCRQIKTERACLSSIRCNFHLFFSFYLSFSFSLSGENLLGSRDPVRIRQHSLMLAVALHRPRKRARSRKRRAGAALTGA